MSEYKYFVKTEKNPKIFNSEEELKKSYPFDVCDPQEHDWRTTFAFGVYDCKKCNARKRVGRKNT